VTLTVLDLFSGIGGFSLGLERAGMETIAFCEIDPFCRQVLAKHWPEIPIYEDVRLIDGKQYRGSVDVVCGGFPCQDVSAAGEKKGFGGERTSLYTEMLRIISESLPDFAVFENVTGLLSGDNGRWFAKFLYDLAEIGYDAEWHCISASYIGGPHHRDRVWIIAYPKREGLQRCIFEGKDICIDERSSFTKFSDRGLYVGFPWAGSNELISLGDGVSKTLARRAVKQYGNAVVPQIPEMIGRAIMAAKYND